MEDRAAEGQVAQPPAAADPSMQPRNEGIWALNCGGERRRRMRPDRIVTLTAAVLVLISRCAFADDLARESAVFEAVFRQQITEHLDATERSRGTVLCLAIDPGGAPQSPTQVLMSRLSPEPSIRRVGECDPRPKGSVEARTLRPAIIVTAGPIEWVAQDEAHVSVSYFRSRKVSARRVYRVVKERSGWVSLGPILLDGPV